MASRVALDKDVVKLLVDALNWDAGPEPDAESIAAARIYFYITNPLITPSVATEIGQTTDPMLANWKNCHFEEISAADDFFLGCVKGMAERYIDYHPDPRDCRVLAEAECAKVEVLLTLNRELIRGLGGRSEAISVLRPSEFWRRAKVPHGIGPRTTPATGNRLAAADWWRW
jgi:hypothetical protein